MSRKTLLSFVILCALPLMAQNTPPARSPMRPARQGGGGCFQKAGVDKSVMEQLFSLQRDAHSQIEEVCSNSSLTPQQKHQQVQEIHQQTHQKIGSLITPEQEKSLVACREQQQDGIHAGAAQLGMGGGCGEMARGGARRGPNGGMSGTSGQPATSAANQVSAQN